MGKVLVVDDDTDILYIVSHILGSKGYEVITEADGDKVLDLVDKVKPHLVLLDVNLDPHDGREICMSIKSKHSMPVVLFSANIHMRRNYRDCGADDFISKPFDIAVIEEMAMRYLN